jgi:hypothetical protein
VIDVVAVVRPEDVVAGFLSVLDPGREVHLVVADRGVYLKMPGGVPLAGRLAALSTLLQGDGAGAKPTSWPAWSVRRCCTRSVMPSGSSGRPIFIGRWIRRWSRPSWI